MRPTDSRTGARSLAGGRPAGRPAAGRRPAFDPARRARGRPGICPREMLSGSRTGPPPTQSNSSGRSTRLIINTRAPHASPAQPHHLRRTSYCFCVYVPARGNGRRTAARWGCAGPPARRPTRQTDRSQRSQRGPAPTLPGAGTGRACSAAAATRPGSQQVKPHASIDRAADARRQRVSVCHASAVCVELAVRENRGRRVRSFPSRRTEPWIRSVRRRRTASTARVSVSSNGGRRCVDVDFR